MIFPTEKWFSTKAIHETAPEVGQYNRHHHMLMKNNVFIDPHKYGMNEESISNVLPTQGIVYFILWCSLLSSTVCLHGSAIMMAQ